MLLNSYLLFIGILLLFIFVIYIKYVIYIKSSSSLFKESMLLFIACIMLLFIANMLPYFVSHTYIISVCKIFLSLNSFHVTICNELKFAQFICAHVWCY